MVDEDADTRRNADVREPLDNCDLGGGSKSARDRRAFE
jgi:hypothetical protein